MAIKKHASAQWKGGLKDGNGTITTQSGALDGHPYAFGQRFEDVKGSNPEELIAAAHSSCFAMALSMMLGEADLKPKQLDVKAEVTLDQVDGGFAVTASHLTLSADVPGAEESKFLEIAEKAKAGCPISKLLKAEISLDAVLKS